MQRSYRERSRNHCWCFTVVPGEDRRVPPRHIALAVLVAVIWGANFVVIDVGLGDLPPTLFVALRFVVVLVPAIALVPRPRVPWRDVVGVGLFMSLGQFALLYTALSVGMPAGLASLVLQAQVVLTVLIAVGGAARAAQPRPGRRHRGRRGRARRRRGRPGRDHPPGRAGARRGRRDLVGGRQRGRPPRRRAGRRCGCRAGHPSVERLRRRPVDDRLVGAGGAPPPLRPGRGPRRPRGGRATP